MRTDPSSVWKQAAQNGLIAGALSLLVSLVGLTESFGDAYIISGLIAVGDLILVAPIFLFANLSIRANPGQSPASQVRITALVGLVAGLVLTAFMTLGRLLDLRAMFVNASPALYNILSRGIPFPAGTVIPPLQAMVAAWIGLGISLIPERYRKLILQGILYVVIVGALRDQILLIRIFQVDPIDTILRTLVFAQSGLSLIGALIIFALAAGLPYFLSTRRKAAPVTRSPKQQRTRRIALYMVLGVVIALLPQILGLFYSEILDTTGLFIMMGLGLNIVIGFAGLLDLGYVAFYAIGAYTMGVLTSSGLGLYDFSFWQALPFALLAAWLAGILLGLPVLRMRGDYLAIVTLGFGEIVRFLALSDWLRGVIGGTQGIQSIAQPQIGPLRFDSVQSLYYLIVIGIVIVAFVAWRLKESRLGRSWMAIREDEDVAQAMGINLVLTKLMAFSTGALFAGLAGALGAAKLTSVYPHSMTFLVSINVLVLIIIGGMGSIPGVFVGALVLIGLPGILTEFEEYRLWFYGLALVFMMLRRPEGLWPEQRRRLELHEAEPGAEAMVEELAPLTTTTD